jgi:5'-methylthioadenosine phosphorylase
MPQAKIGVIGGSGLYQIEGMTDIQELNLNTPFGKSSDSIILGKLNGTGIAFLPRHGRGHRILPSEIPARANIYAFKSLGVEYIIGINTCGSFKEEVKPGHFLIPDQAIDRTQGRISTFFGDGVVAHVSMADPFCNNLSRILLDSAHETGATVHPKGTYVAMEGPAFSTRGESLLYKSWGADVIGMTIFPEAKLAREAEICYASICCVTDYDCWKDENVSTEIILGFMHKNIATAKQIIKTAVSKIPLKRGCQCASALKAAIVTAPTFMTLEQKKKFNLLIGKYIEK